MRKSVIAGFLVMILAAGFAHAETVPARQKVYALVAAVGDRFTFIQKKESIGSRFEPYDRETRTVGDNQLNRKVLYGMDLAVAARDPGSKRVFLAFPGNALNSAGMAEIEQVAIDNVIAVLKPMAQRREWDRIIVATPAYKALEFNGTTVRLYGFGVFYQPLKRSSDSISGTWESRSELMSQDWFATLDYSPDEGTPGSVAATTPANQSAFVRFVAPYAFVTIWVLDPITLEVIDKQRRYASMRLFDREPDAANIGDSLDGKFLIKDAAELMQRAITTAVKQSAVLFP
jgi:hypothetical protein